MKTQTMQTKENQPIKKPISAWADISPDGEPRFCYSARKYGKKVEQKLTLKELEEFVRDYLREEKGIKI